MDLRPDHALTRKGLQVLVGITMVVLVAGIALYAMDLNDSFYADAESVRGVFETLTELGNDKLYLVVLGLIYLSYDKRFGRRLCLVFFFIVYATDVLKEFFRDPRPAVNWERESPNSGYGFPSGHTTTSVTFYGYILLSHFGRDRVRLALTMACAFALVVVPVSRMVIGAHDLQDVAGGAVIALTVMISYMVLLPRFAPAVKAWPLRWQLGIGVPVALLFWLMGAMILALRHPGDIIVGLEATSMGAGLLLGCAIAFPIEEEYVDYRPEKMGLKRRLIAAVIGLPMTILVYYGMSEFTDTLLPEHAADVLTYMVLIVVLTLIVPAFLKRSLAGEGPAQEGDGA